MHWRSLPHMGTLPLASHQLLRQNPCQGEARACTNMLKASQTWDLLVSSAHQHCQWLACCRRSQSRQLLPARSRVLRRTGAVARSSHSRHGQCFKEPVEGNNSQVQVSACAAWRVAIPVAATAAASNRGLDKLPCCIAQACPSGPCAILV